MVSDGCFHDDRKQSSNVDTDTGTGGPSSKDIELRGPELLEVPRLSCEWETDFSHMLYCHMTLIFCNSHRHTCSTSSLPLDPWCLL